MGNGGTRRYGTRRGRGLGGIAPEASLRYGKRGYKGVRIAPRRGTRRHSTGGLTALREMGVQGGTDAPRPGTRRLSSGARPGTRRLSSGSSLRYGKRGYKGVRTAPRPGTRRRSSGSLTALLEKGVQGGTYRAEAGDSET